MTGKHTLWNQSCWETLTVVYRYPKSRTEMTLDILKQGPSRTPTIEDDLPIVKEACGLRPIRKDGLNLKLELEHFSTPRNGQQILVVNN